MNHDSDADVWIGYSDFLTTLVILFFVLLVIHLTSRPTVLAGRVVDGAGRGVSNCMVSAHRLESSSAGGGSLREDAADVDGQFLWEFDVEDTLSIEVRADCREEGAATMLNTLYPGATSRLDVVVGGPGVAGDSVLTRISVSGDALFEKDQWRLTDEGVRQVRQVGLRLRRELETHGGVLAVQGHTDSSPFARDAGTDNWRLSVNRAASAAEILRDPGYGVNIPGCRLAVMGFGPTRPDTEATTNREQRRIEFSILRGADLTEHRPVCK